MEEQLNLLIQLQEIDTRIRILDERKNRLPEILSSLEKRSAAGRNELDRSREELETAQKQKRDRDKDLEIEAQKIDKLKARTSEIKTNKEYQALLKEIETAEQGNKAIEDEILVLMEEIESASAALTDAENKARTDELEIGSERKEQETAIEKIEEELKEAEQQRREAAARIQPSILEQYQKLLITKAGFAIAVVRGESCSGCFMSIPPQVFVNVKKNESFITCPNCGRFLFYKG